MTPRKLVGGGYVAWAPIALCAVMMHSCTRAAPRGPERQSPPAQLGLGLGSSTVLKHPRNEVVTELDLNQDRKSDVWSYRIITRGPGGTRRELLLRKELDINGDGRVDVIRFYDADERLVREAVDLDFDGSVDQLNHYHQELIVLKERDTDGDGQADEWRHFAQGKPIRRERDTDGDGLPNAVEHANGEALDLHKTPEIPEASPNR